MSINTQVANALSQLATALGADNGASDAAPAPVATGFEGVAAPADNGLNTKMYLRSAAQTISPELVGNITYGELVEKYFSIDGSYSITITRDETSETVSPDEVYGSGVSTIIVTEQSASLG